MCVERQIVPLPAPGGAAGALGSTIDRVSGEDDLTSRRLRIRNTERRKLRVVLNFLKILIRRPLRSLKQIIMG
jgi:hypothetical protein